MKDRNYNFDSDFVIDPQSRFFILENSGQFTRNQMQKQIKTLMNSGKEQANLILILNAVFLALGILSQIIFALILAYLINKINTQKVEILSIFLDTTEKDIQVFSDRT